MLFPDPTDRTTTASPTLEQMKRTRYQSLNQQISHSDNYCCKCGYSFRVPGPSAHSNPSTSNSTSPSHSPQTNTTSPVSKRRPLGRLLCRNTACRHAACAHCNFISPWILHDLPNNTLTRQRPDDGAPQSILGFVCCEPGCGWSQTIPAPSTAARGRGREAPRSRPLALAASLLHLFACALPRFRPVLPQDAEPIDLSTLPCRAPRDYGIPCPHTCCPNCIKFILAGKDAATLRAEEAARARLLDKLQLEYECALARICTGEVDDGEVPLGAGCRHLPGKAACRMECRVLGGVRWSPGGEGSGAGAGGYVHRDEAVVARANDPPLVEGVMVPRPALAQQSTAPRPGRSNAQKRAKKAPSLTAARRSGLGDGEERRRRRLDKHLCPGAS